ncbi:DHHC palmitoyltransferase-domain-containing protein, partial [Ephemerocybe angulata]
WAFIMALCVYGSERTGVWWWKEAGDPPPVGLGNTGLNLRPGLSSLDKLGVEGRDWTPIVIVCAYLTAMVISSMFMTAFSDPGVLPRGLDLNPPFPANSPSDGGLRAPMPRDLKVREDVVRCKTYRPPRASHCKMCDNCVDGCDHHCQWVNNCVGSRNYTTFFVLLMSATLTAILVIVTAALHLYYLTVWQRYTFKEALSQGAGSAVIWPVGALLSYHLRLLLLNITTIEQVSVVFSFDSNSGVRSSILRLSTFNSALLSVVWELQELSLKRSLRRLLYEITLGRWMDADCAIQIRNQAHKTLIPGPPPPNPFSHGSWRKNFVAVLCRPQPLSWLDAAGVATEDRRDVNPGLLGEVVSVRERVAGERGLRSARSDLSGWEGGARVRKDVEEEED